MGNERKNDKIHKFLLFKVLKTCFDLNFLVCKYCCGLVRLVKSSKSQPDAYAQIKTVRFADLVAALRPPYVHSYPVPL